MPGRKEHQHIGGTECKHCPTCDTWKPLPDYGKQTSSWDKLSRMCRVCFNKYKANKRATDPKYKETDARLTEKYKASGKTAERNRKRYEAKKPELIQAAMKYQRKRYATDPKYRISVAVRRRFAKLVKQIHNYDKNAKELTGCSWQELQDHLTSQFKEGMTWDNHGIHGWHIDHIRPCKSFDLSDPEQQKLCFHYTNLQPLWAHENLEKSDIWIPIDT